MCFFNQISWLCFVSMVGVCVGFKEKTEASKHELHFLTQFMFMIENYALKKLSCGTQRRE